ncbi:hypothetical protein A0H81_09911 [Grifola frondosa]|uniref:Uncharacterized protein n=1 Tax=Grifola frondosa TaxID=5627 RepID=A0A1C7LZ74_GRIFR|nr:hypothetical protein A0H81_09911 [Grifola frondosa]
MSVTPFTMIFQNRVFAQVRDLLRLPHGGMRRILPGSPKPSLSGLIGDVTVKVLAELQGLKRMAKIAGVWTWMGSWRRCALSALRPSSRGPVADEKAGSPGSPRKAVRVEWARRKSLLSPSSFRRPLATEDEGVVTTRPSSLRRLVLLREARHSRHTTITVTVRTPDAQA